MATISKRLIGALIAGLALGAASAASAAETELRFDRDTIKLELGGPQRASWGLRGWSRLGLAPTRPLFAHRLRAVDTSPVAADVALASPVAAVAGTKVRDGFERIRLTAPMGEISGQAAWAGADTDGRLTASGERYDMYRLTAASAELPLNALVSVTNPATGESVVVRINDRKPVDSQMLTLSMAAANRISLDRTPDARVTARYIGDAAQPSRVAMVTSYRLAARW